MRHRYGSPGKISLGEKIFWMVFSIGYWIGMVFLASYVQEHPVIGRWFGTTIYLHDAIWPLALILWGMFSIILDATFKKR